LLSEGQRVSILTPRCGVEGERREMKIVLAIDGSACSNAAVDEVARRCWPNDSQVRIISVVEPPAQLTSGPWAYALSYEEQEALERAQAEKTLAAAAAKLREQKENCHLGITTKVIVGSPKRVIVEEAEKWGADLIVVGSHGYRSWERMLLGSVSQAVAMHAECSVEIVRQK
jgi:nucleotide-binding universal stress UspA family protein